MSEQTVEERTSGKSGVAVTKMGWASGLQAAIHGVRRMRRRVSAQSMLPWPPASLSSTQPMCTAVDTARNCWVAR